MKDQKQFRYRLPDGCKVSNRSRDFAEAAINGSNSQSESDREIVRGLATHLRAEVRQMVRIVSTCAPAHVEGNMGAARALQRVVRAAVENRLLPEIECERTERQLAHPLTVADFLAVLELTIAQTRGPACFEHGEAHAELQRVLHQHGRILRQLAAVAGVAVNEDGTYRPASAGSHARPSAQWGGL